MNHQQITEHLISLGDADIAAHSQRYFKTGPGEYGYGDKFLGIRIPVLRQNIKYAKALPIADIEKLLQSEYHEIRLFALLLMVNRYQRNPSDRESMYQIYLNNLSSINNWDLVDCSAHKIIGPHIENSDRSLLYQLARSEHLWSRRIAIITTFHFIRQDDFHDALQLAELLLNDKEDLLHKATGWVLREIGKKDQASEVAFLNRHYSAMPRTMLRYAIEKFPNHVREQYLKGEI